MLNLKFLSVLSLRFVCYLIPRPNKFTTGVVGLVNLVICLQKLKWILSNIIKDTQKYDIDIIKCREQKIKRKPRLEIS